MSLDWESPLNRIRVFKLFYITSSSFVVTRDVAKPCIVYTLAIIKEGCGPQKVKPLRPNPLPPKDFFPVVSLVYRYRYNSVSSLTIKENKIISKKCLGNKNGSSR